LLGEGAIKVREISPTARASLDEYRRRFQAWSKYYGVFAHKSINLDHRVRKKPRIQDIIVRQVDSMYADYFRHALIPATDIQAPFHSQA
jgi:hypothetical protein